jgi:hypothetical protein
VPVRVDQWTWSCGFYPMSHRGQRANGTAPDFFKARADFKVAWLRLLPKVTDADLAEHRRERAWMAWKYRMWGCGKLPTQETSGRSKCFCGRGGRYQGRRALRLHRANDMKFAEPRPFANHDVAARKIVELANAVEAVQDGRIHIEKINGPFLFQLKGAPDEYKAGLDRAIEKGWLVLHESGTFEKFTQAGADLFA